MAAKDVKFSTEARERMRRLAVDYHGSAGSRQAQEGGGSDASRAADGLLTRLAPGRLAGRAVPSCLTKEITDKRDARTS
jgi:hypothetical protein